MSLNQHPITKILLTGLLDWVHIIEITLTISLSHLTITKLHWVNMIEVMLNVSLNQHTTFIILLAGLLDGVNMIEIKLTYR